MKVKIIWSTCGEVNVDMSDEDFGLLKDDTSKFSVPCDLDDLEGMPNAFADKVREAIMNSLFDNPVEIDEVDLVVERKHVGAV